MKAAYLLPLTIAALAVAVVAPGYRASRRRGYGPLVLGVVAAVGLLVGKFAVDSNVMVYGSIAGLVGASLWNAWPNRPKTGVPSSPAGALYQLGSVNKENRHGYQT